MNKSYDVVVVGGGAAGLTAAKTARGFGKSAIIVEKEKLGGECTWTGCVPSKTLIKSAEIAYYAQHFNTYGLRGNVSLDTSNLMEHVRSVVREIYSTHSPEILKKDFAIDTLFGPPRFVDPYTLEIGDERIVGKKFIIATGSSAAIPPIVGLDDIMYFTNETLFESTQLPQSMVIIGGGPIGIEMASALNRLGVLTSVVEMQEHILPKDDPELTDKLMDCMKKEGVLFFTHNTVKQVSQSGELIQVSIESTQGEHKTITAQALLIATGRRPNIGGLDLEKIGVKTTKKAVIVNDYMRTSVPHIYACGDVAGPYLFSHMAWYQATIAVRNALVPIFKERINYKKALWVTFSAPELAATGLTEEQARVQYGDKITVVCQKYASLDRAHTDRELEGEAKFICDKQGYILGAHILGARAGELIHEVQQARLYNKKFTDIAGMIHAYPTYSEVIWHGAKRAYVDTLLNTWYIRLLKKWFGRR